MKFFLGQKRKRQLVYSFAGLLCLIIVGWAQVYYPFQENKTDLADELEKLSEKRDHLSDKLKRLTEYVETNKLEVKDTSGYEALKIEGRSLEELSASTNANIQRFLEKKAIPIKGYKDMPATKWRGHSVSLIELQLETGMQGVSDILEYFETLNKLIRIERFSVFFRRTKTSDLQISLQIATLQIEGNKP